MEAVEDPDAVLGRHPGPVIDDVQPRPPRVRTGLVDADLEPDRLDGVRDRVVEQVAHDAAYVVGVRTCRGPAGADSSPQSNRDCCTERCHAWSAQAAAHARQTR